MSKYKTYEFSYKGKYIEGRLLVVSTSEKGAYEAANKKLLEQGSNPDTLKLLNTNKMAEGAVVYNFNGDY